ncbi:hypothetical protein HMN09_00504600 [Mycena chlorophos]|uniref:DUF6699 domain-containing protein n=1 Tax=Mycena chlorophos TaxID=658473 RepID=A0A8H6WD58_MYCCL|nr:hypothetical protein HMN09_00504600 [Mycena chlorophos]
MNGPTFSLHDGGGRISGGGYIPPPPEAITGGQPMGGGGGLFGAFPGHGAAAASGGWGPPAGAGAGPAPWGAQPGAAAGPSGWANTPAQHPSYPPWTGYGQPPPMQQQPVQAGWGTGAHTPGHRSNPSTPWMGHAQAQAHDPWGGAAQQAPPHASGFSAMAAPPSSAPVTAGWGGGVAAGATPYHAAQAGLHPHAQYAAHLAAQAQAHAHGGQRPRIPHPEDPEEEFYDYEAEEEAERAEAWANAMGGHTPQHAQAQGQAADPGWAAWGVTPPAATPAQIPGAFSGGWGDDPYTAAAHAMRRTHSGGAKTPHPHQHRQRAHSYSAPAPPQDFLPQQHQHQHHQQQRAPMAPWAQHAQAQAHAAQYQYNEDHLAKRPITWRPDFPGIGEASINGPASSSSASGGSGGGGFSLFRRKSASGTNADEWHDPRKRNPCPTFTIPSASSSAAAMYGAHHHRYRIAYDLRVAPEHTPPGGMGAFLPREAGEMGQPAVHPPAARMRIVLARSPWYVDVKAGSAGGVVTLYDVLAALHVQLQAPIASNDYFTRALSKTTRGAITGAFKERCEKVGAMRAAGGSHVAGEGFCE